MLFCQYCIILQGTSILILIRCDTLTEIFYFVYHQLVHILDRIYFSQEKNKNTKYFLCRIEIVSKTSLTSETNCLVGCWDKPLTTNPFILSSEKSTAQKNAFLNIIDLVTGDSDEPDCYLESELWDTRLVGVCPGRSYRWRTWRLNWK